MTLRYMTGESREDEERRNCQRCDHYRGYVCAEHREPSYESMKEALSGIAACGHENRFTEWEDHSKPISCVKCRLAAAEALDRDYQEVRDRLDAANERLAAAESDIGRLNQMLREAGYGQGQIDSYAAECEEHDRCKEKLAAAEAAARFYAKWYDGPAEALLGEEDRRAFMWIEENGGEP